MPLAPGLHPFNWPTWVFLPYKAVLFILLIAAISTRYKRYSTPVQRQQTKWFLWGMAILSLVFLVFNFDLPGRAFIALRQPGMPRLVYHLAGLPVLPLAFLLPALTVFFAILRYKLWEIDLIIRRSLVYSGSVILSQGLVLVATGQHSSGTIILSTLAVAVLVNPARRRIQAGIDRRFCRRRYEAEQALAVFSAALRQEVDLDQLSRRLIQVVEDTMEPESVNLWLRKPKESRR